MALGEGSWLHLLGPVCVRHGRGGAGRFGGKEGGSTVPAEADLAGHVIDRQLPGGAGKGRQGIAQRPRTQAQVCGGPGDRKSPRLKSRHNSDSRLRFTAYNKKTNKQ